MKASSAPRSCSENRAKSVSRWSLPLAFDGKLLGQVVRIFADTAAVWYRRRHVERGLPPGETGAVTVIQRANSDLWLCQHYPDLSACAALPRKRSTAAVTNVVDSNRMT
jgi:hypothetical protein